MFFLFIFCSFSFAFFVRKFRSHAQSNSLCVTMAIEQPTLWPASRRRHSQSIETSTHWETSTTWTEPFLVELLQTSYPRLPNYKAFAAVCLFLKSDKKIDWKRSPQRRPGKQPEQSHLQKKKRKKKKKKKGGRTRTEVQYCRVPKNGLPKNGQAGISSKNKNVPRL